MTVPRLTVAIPLYRGRAWLRNVASSIARLPADARIVLSDEVDSDDAPALLARRFANDPRVVVRVRQGRPGWREHCNALIAENGSPFFALLPQDDTIAAGHYEALVGALTQDPSAGMAFGRLIAEHEDGQKVTQSRHRSSWAEACPGSRRCCWSRSGTSGFHSGR